MMHIGTKTNWGHFEQFGGIKSEMIEMLWIKCILRYAAIAESKKDRSCVSNIPMGMSFHEDSHRRVFVSAGLKEIDLVCCNESIEKIVL